MLPAEKLFNKFRVYGDEYTTMYDTMIVRPKSMKCLINFLHERVQKLSHCIRPYRPPAWNRKKELNSLKSHHLSCLENLFQFTFFRCYVNPNQKLWKLLDFFSAGMTFPLGWVQLLSNGWQCMIREVELRIYVYIPLIEWENSVELSN